MTMLWKDLQDQFGKSLKMPNLPPPDPIGKTDAAPSLKRFNVYRNNSAVALTEALGSGFPVVRQLVGEEFFSAMASVYMQTNLPSSPVLINFGESFAEFIKNFEPAHSVPYLADMARLEWLWTQSYNAADAAPVPIDALSRFPPEQMGDINFILHPSLRLIKSDWPVLSIWSAHHQTNTQQLLEHLDMTPEFGLIVRPYLDVNVLALLNQVYTFIAYTAGNCTLGESFQQLENADQEDLGGCLQLLFDSGAVIGLET